MILEKKTKREKSKKKNLEKRWNNLEDSKKRLLLIILASILVVCLIVYAYARNNTRNYNNIKQDKSELLVYTKYNKTIGKYTKKIPHVNINSEAVAAVNVDIITFANDFIEDKENIITYEYNINGIILSLVMKAVDNTDSSKVYFRTYNINLDTMTVIADEALLDFYKITTAEVEQRIREGFENIYADEVEEEYIDANECDYECFLKWRGVDNYLDDISYYIKEGKLICFKPFTIQSLYGEEDYFEDKHFEFLLQEESVQ